MHDDPGRNNRRSDRRPRERWHIFFREYPVCGRSDGIKTFSASGTTRAMDRSSLHKENRARRKEELAADLRKQFTAELALGMEYQKKYQAYEAETLQSGVKPDSPGFYDDFYRRHGDIASEPGSEDFIAFRRAPKSINWLNSLPVILLAMGIMGFLGSCTGRVGGRKI